MIVDLSERVNFATSGDAESLDTDPDVIAMRLAAVRPNTIYRHYKGPTYVVLAVSYDEGTRAPRIIYLSIVRAAEGAVDQPSGRLASEFFQDVLWQARRQPRFEKVGPAR